MIYYILTLLLRNGFLSPVFLRRTWNARSAYQRFEAHVYPDAGHLFTVDSDALGTGWDIMYGGTREGDAAAYVDSKAILLDRLARWHGKM